MGGQLFLTEKTKTTHTHRLSARRSVQSALLRHRPRGGSDVRACEDDADGEEALHTVAGRDLREVSERGRWSGGRSGGEGKCAGKWWAVVVNNHEETIYW